MIFSKMSKFTLMFYICLIISISQCLRFLLNMDFQVEGWSSNTNRNISYYFNDDLTEIIPESFCKNKVKLLIIVPSSFSNINARQAIRQTWGSEKTVHGQNISIYFCVGNSLDPSEQESLILESSEYKDIIQGSFIDTYNNLTLKTAFAIKLTANNCIGKAEYLLKIDDDVFLQPNKLMEMLMARNTSTDVLVGRMSCNTFPIKNPFDKWYCPSYLFNKKYFPNYLSGPTYLMSVDVAKKIDEISYRIPLIHLEDVYFTGICTENAGISPKHDWRFNTNHLADEPCILKDLIASHFFSPDRIRSTFQLLSSSDYSEKCRNYRKMVSIKFWIREKIFQPFTRSKRKRICM